VVLDRVVEQRDPGPTVFSLAEFSTMQHASSADVITSSVCSCPDTRFEARPAFRAAFWMVQRLLRQPPCRRPRVARGAYPKSHRGGLRNEISRQRPGNAVTALLLVGLVSAENQDFVRMFPRLPAFEPSDVALANLGACTPVPCTRQSTGPIVDPDLAEDSSPKTPRLGSRTSGSSWTTT
jgi:hypothetical protein